MVSKLLHPLSFDGMKRTPLGVQKWALNGSSAPPATRGSGLSDTRVLHHSNDRAIARPLTKRALDQTGRNSARNA